MRGQMYPSMVTDPKIVNINTQSRGNVCHITITKFGQIVIDEYYQ